MKYFFTEEDQLTDVRGAEIRAALVHAHHEVERGRLGEAAPPGVDVWMYGMGADGGPPLGDHIVRSLLDSHAKVVLFQICDAPSMSFYRIPDALAERAQLFLRNHWPRDRTAIPEKYRARIGWLPPMLKRMAANPGRPLAARSGGSIFYGTRTGLANMPNGENAREKLVRIMRASTLPFQGGISPHAEKRYHTSRDLLVPRMNERRHNKLLSDTKVCLAPWGNHPLTYRLFEGMALRCLVVAQPFRDTSFLDGGLEPGRHYVEVAADLHDVVDVVRYYLEHLDEAQRIADAGHEHFKRFFESRRSLVSSYLFESTVASWNELYRPSTRKSVVMTTRSFAASLFADRF